MEEVFQRFPHLSEDIFKVLDNETLANCERVSKVWYSYFDYHNFLQNRRVKIIQETIGKFHQIIEEFQTSFDTIRMQNILNAARMGDFETVQQSMIEGIAIVHDKIVIIEDFSILHWAAGNGYFDVAKYIVDTTEDKNPRDTNCNRPLHYAAMNGHIDTLKYLVDKEVKSRIAGPYKNLEINPRNNSGDTPLHLAALMGHPEIVMYIVDRIKCKNPRNNLGTTPLHKAALRGHLDIVMYLVDRIRNKNPRNDLGTTPLHEAALRGHLDIVKYLFDRIKNKNPRNNLGTTPLHEAAKEGHIDVVKYIVANIDEKNPSDKRGDTPRKLAISNQHFDIAKLLNICIKLIPRSKLL